VAIASERPPNRRLIGFLALSLALHALWLAVPLRTRNAAPEGPKPFVARLLPRVDLAIEPARTEPAPKSAVVERLSVPATTPRSNAASVTATISPAATTPASPTINLDAAVATARAYAREAQPRTSLDAPKRELTVETVIARATAPDVMIETRGANGEHVTLTKHTRCVTPLTVPHYMQGMEIPTQCGAR
jgi:hypothetical protein